MEFLIQQHKIYFGLAALAFDVMLSIFSYIKYSDRPQARAFRVLVIATTLATLMEIVRHLGYFVPASENSTYFLQRMLQSLNFITSTSCGYAYTIYLGNYVQRKSWTSIFDKINSAVYFAYVAILIANIWTGWVVSYNPEVNPTDLVRGPLYLYLGYLVPMYFIAYGVILFLCGMRKLQLRIKLTMLFAAVFIVVTMIVQSGYLHGEVTITTFGMSFGLFLWYFAVENSDYQNLLRTTNALLEEKKRAQSANKAKNAFLSNMSYEIRSPMNIVLGLDEMILNSRDRREIYDYARSIKTAGKSLLAIVNDILDFSKIESGKMELVEDDFHFAALLRDLEFQMSLRAAKHEIIYRNDVDGNLPEYLRGDEVRLRQVLAKLISGGIRFTKEGSVTLTVRGYTEGSRVTLRMTVKDTGGGMTAEKFNSLFTSFEEPHSETGTTDDVLLDLVIVERLTKLMGGTFEGDTQLGDGTSFTVTIPFEIAGDGTISSYRTKEDDVVEQSMTDMYSAPEAKVLVVDDNKLNLIVATGFLKRTKSQVTTCESGAACLELLTKEKYDIIFLDHMMPDMDGIETLKCSRDLPGNLNGDTPVIALTANAVAGMREKYIELGFSDYISKPIDSKALFQVFYNSIPKEKIVMA